MTGLKIKNVDFGQEKILKVDGVFIEIGYDAETALVQGLVSTNPAGEIEVDSRCKTKTPGLFAAGDLTTVPYKQTVISAGMGAIAALEAYSYINQEERHGNSK